MDSGRPDLAVTDNLWNVVQISSQHDNGPLQPKSDHADTLENSKANFVSGVTGGDGSNFAGGLSGTKSVTP